MKPGQIRPIVVSVFRDGDRIFLAQYHDPSSGERFYRPLGGAIAFGEHSRECIVREIREEMGTEITELTESEQLCKPELCGYACIETCPIGALGKDEAQEFTMDGHAYRYGALDHNRCRWCLDGFTQGSGSRTHFEPPEKITQTDLERAADNRELPDKGLYAVAHIDFCGKCMHQCPSPEFEYVPRPIERFQGRTGCRYLPRAT